MKIPVGTETEEKEVHHHTEIVKVSRPVFMEIPDFFFYLAIAILLALVWQSFDPSSPPPSPPSTINIHIENK